MRSRRKRMENWLLKYKSLSHPRILRLYHKMAPTASIASSSNRSTGTTMEVVPAREIINIRKRSSKRLLFLNQDGLNCVTYSHWKQKNPQELQQSHTCSRSIPQDTCTQSHSEGISTLFCQFTQNILSTARAEYFIF